MENGHHEQITTDLVSELIQTQFPQWAQLPLQPVERQGFDNRTFRLGSEMSVRLPSDDSFAPQALKEQQWLPFLAANLSTQIPQILEIGQASRKFSRSWSIRRWIEGQSVNELKDFDPHLIVQPLAQFLNELHALDGTGGPAPGPHSFFRGDHLSVYDDEAQEAFSKLEGVIDLISAQNIWREALESRYEGLPVWIHGDMNTGNVLVKEGKLAAVIDFGILTVGDPACDLVMAWTYFKGENRKVFRQKLNRDAAMWARARGWALWKVLYQLAFDDQMNSEQVLRTKNLFVEIVKD